jgi:hypothetical protein
VLNRLASHLESDRVRFGRWGQPSPVLRRVPLGPIVSGLSSALRLDDPGDSTTNGTQLEIYTCNLGKNQYWWAA